MKGLSRIPQSIDLQNSYESLLFSNAIFGESEIALWSQWSRFDPRLAEILTGWLARSWKSLSPLLLRQELIKRPWPAAFGVILDQATHGIASEDKSVYSSWMNLVMVDIPLGLNEQFFIGIRSFGKGLMLRDVTHSTRSYLRWGYFGYEILLNKSKNLKNRTQMNSKMRKLLLDELILKQERITVNSYIEALDGNVSRRQAERDLKSHLKLNAIGNTKARFYVGV